MTPQAALVPHWYWAAGSLHPARTKSGASCQSARLLPSEALPRQSAALWERSVSMPPRFLCCIQRLPGTQCTACDVYSSTRQLWSTQWLASSPRASTLRAYHKAHPTGGSCRKRGAQLASGISTIYLLSQPPSQPTVGLAAASLQPISNEMAKLSASHSCNKQPDLSVQRKQCRVLRLVSSNAENSVTWKACVTVLTAGAVPWSNGLREEAARELKARD